MDSLPIFTYGTQFDREYLDVVDIPVTVNP